MTAQLMVVGDIHLHQDARNAQRLASWDSIIATGLELPRLGAWLVCGDVFHAKSAIQDRNDAAQRLQAMCQVAPVLVASGNHDHSGDLDVFERLAGRFPIKVFAVPDSYTFEMATGDRATAAILPYPHKGVLAAMGLPPDELMTAGGSALLDICRQLGAELAEAHAEGDATFFLGHVNVTGAISSSGQPLVGRELSIAAEHLAALGDVPKILGHIHAPQVVHGAYYAGSISRNDFGEREEKRALIVSLGPGHGQYAFHSRTLDVPAMWHVSGELTRDGFTHDLPAGTDVAGAEVRVRYKFAQSEQRLLDHDLARRPFAAAADLKVEPIAVPDRALRAPAVAQATTLADKLTAWAEATGNVTSAAVLDKLARLQTTDEATLRAAVEAWLAQAEGELRQESERAA